MAGISDCLSVFLSVGSLVFGQSVDSSVRLFLCMSACACRPACLFASLTGWLVDVLHKLHRDATHKQNNMSMRIKGAAWTSGWKGVPAAICGAAPHPSRNDTYDRFVFRNYYRNHASFLILVGISQLLLALKFPETRKVLHKLF